MAICMLLMDHHTGIRTEVHRMTGLSEGMQMTSCYTGSYGHVLSFKKNKLYLIEKDLKLIYY